MSSRRAGRRADWLVVLAALLALGLFWTWWVYYTEIHQQRRFTQTAPGATVTVEAGTIRLLSLVRTDTLESGYGDPGVAPAGGVYVVGEVEVTITTTDSGAAYGPCGLVLVGADGRIWETATLDVSRKDTVYCSDLKRNVPTTIEQIYLVNVADAASIYGLGSDDRSSTDPIQVLTPPTS